MRSPFLAALLLAAGAPLVAQSYRANFATPIWTSPVEFTEVASIRELSDGRLIVPDPRENVIRLLAADGKHLRDIGRPGGGPKEFGLALLALPLPGDSTLIHDRPQERFLLIGPDAEPVRTIPWPLGENAGLNERAATDGQGNFYFTKEVFPRSGNSTALLRWHLGAPRVDSIATVRTQVVARYTMTDNGREVAVTRAIPYASGDGWAVGPSGQLAIVDPEQYLVTWRDADGTIRKGSRIPYTPIPISASDRSAAFDGVDAATQQRLHLPTTKPAVHAFTAQMAPNGELWVLRYGSGEAKTRVWDVIDRNGRVARSVELSKDRMVVGFGKRNVYVIHVDEDGLQHLEAYR